MSPKWFGWKHKSQNDSKFLAFYIINSSYYLVIILHLWETLLLNNFLNCRLGLCIWCFTYTGFNKKNFVFADHNHKHTYNGQNLQAITMGVGKVIKIREVVGVGGSNILWVIFINKYHDCVDYNIIFVCNYSFHKLDFGKYK